MSIGKRIKKHRTNRGMTQKELGIAAGFGEKTADVRIAQYEAGTRTPKDKTITNIANALNVSPKTIESPDITITIETKFPIEANKTYFSVGCWVDYAENECTTCDNKSIVTIKDKIFSCPVCFDGGEPRKRNYHVEKYVFHSIEEY
jgi:transcriptional regulator with XRE-family HTH domain